MLNVLITPPQAHSSVQPHHKSGGTLLETLIELKRQAEAQNAQAASQPVPPAATPITPEQRYRAALNQWVAGMAPMQRTQPYTLNQVIRLAGLTGKGDKRASVQLVARLLHEMGFAAKRDWTRAGRNSRYWTLGK